MKPIILSILIGSVFIAGAILLSQKSDGVEKKEVVSNVSEVEGKQVVTISAKGGYFPQQSIARADTPTILRMETRGSFDCSTALTIPALGYRKNLPPSGTTEIEIPPQSAGTKLQGLCSMGMYNFEIVFK